MSGKKLNWQPISNATIPNCGTGKGGFQPGNTCAARGTFGRFITEEHSQTRRPHAGTVSGKHLSKFGKQVLKQLGAIVGRQPQIIVDGNKMWFYWWNPGERLKDFDIARDYLTDQGIDSKIEQDDKTKVVRIFVD